MPVVVPDPKSPEFDTQHAAARALADAFAAAGNAETAGVLYKNTAGKFVYSTTMPGTGDKFELRVGMPKGHTLAGIVHSHPSDEPSSQVFSPDDINVAETLKVPSYVRFLHDSTTRVYSPGQTKTQRMTMPGYAKFPVKVAAGDDVPTPQPVIAPQAPATVDATTPAPAQAPPPFAAFAASPTPQS